MLNKEKPITEEEQKLFDKELKDHWEAYAQFGPFEPTETFRWFFLRGMDVANERAATLARAEALDRKADAEFSDRG